MKKQRFKYLYVKLQTFIKNVSIRQSFIKPLSMLKDQKFNVKNPIILSINPSPLPATPQHPKWIDIILKVFISNTSENYVSHKLFLQLFVSVV